MAAAALSAGSGCALSGLSFRVDERLTIVTPGDRQEVALPFEVRFTTTAPVGAVWAVVDGAPPRPGRGLRAYAVDADDCAASDAQCPTAEVLASRGVVPSGAGVVTIAAVRRSIAGATDSELHRVTLFTLGPDGRRTSESAWSVDVRVEARRLGS